MPEIGKIFISVDHGKFHEDCQDPAVRSILPRVRGVYCVLFFGKQRAKTPPIPGLNSLSWSAFEFEFSVIEESSQLSVSLYAQIEDDPDTQTPVEDMLLCSWNEDTELLEDGNYERWVELYANEVELCRLQLHLRMECSRHVEDSIGLDDFDELTAIGEGAFGKVLTVRKKDTGKIYAMKVLEKGRVQSKRQLMRMLGERNILMKVHSPFIVGLHFAFQTADKVYLVLDFVGGGDLFYHLKLHKRFSQSCVQFWGAEIVCALDALHQRSIVYRDLKPENILLEPDGHIVLVDFGLAKQMQHSVMHGVEGRSNSFVGTPEYLAPEVVQGTGHTMTVDWWTLGILLFELLLGKPPFKAKDLSILYQRIVAEDVVVPQNKLVEDMSPECRSIIRGFLNRNPNSRLGHQGTAQVRAHPFFASIDWPKLEQKQLSPPYTPLSPADYLQKVFTMVKEEPVKEKPPPQRYPPSPPSPLKNQPSASAKISSKQGTTLATGGLTPPTLSSASGISKPPPLHLNGSAPVIPDYFASIVTLIEKWQTRILEIPNVLEDADTPTEPFGPDLSLRSRSHDSSDTSPRGKGSADSKFSRSNHKRTQSQRSSGDKSKGKSNNSGETFIKVAVSPGISPALAIPSPADAKGQSMLAGLLFGPEVLDLETMIREMQEKLESQQELLISQDKELLGAKAERELLKAQLMKVSQGKSSSSSASKSTSGEGSPTVALSAQEESTADESQQMSIVMEESKTLMNLANKMAAVMATSVGPVGTEIADILSEAQTLMGLARQEHEAVTQTGATQSAADAEASAEANWQEMVKQQTANLVKEQKSEEKMSKMAKQLSETEDSYMQAMVESQQTLATAAVERDALLQLASKLEEQTRVQSEREAQVVEMLNHKCQELAVITEELKKVQQSEATLLDERDSLLATMRELTPQKTEGNESYLPDSPKHSPTSPPNVNRQSSWPNPIKWLFDSKKKQVDELSDHSGLEEEVEEEEDKGEEELQGEDDAPDDEESVRSSLHSTRSVLDEWDKEAPSCESAAEVVTVSPTEVMDEESVNVRYYEVEQLPRSKSLEPRESHERERIVTTIDEAVMTTPPETSPSLLVVM